MANGPGLRPGAVRFTAGPSHAAAVSWVGDFNRASSGVTEKACVSVRPMIEGAGRAAGDVAHCGGDGRVVELAGAEEAEERIDEAGRGTVVRHARTGLVVGKRLVAQRAPERAAKHRHLFAGCQRLGAAQR